VAEPLRSDIPKGTIAEFSTKSCPGRGVFWSSHRPVKQRGGNASKKKDRKGIYSSYRHREMPRRRDTFCWGPQKKKPKQRQFQNKKKLGPVCFKTSQERIFGQIEGHGKHKPKLVQPKKMQLFWLRKSKVRKWTHENNAEELECTSKGGTRPEPGRLQVGKGWLGLPHGEETGAGNGFGQATLKEFKCGGKPSSWESQGCKWGPTDVMRVGDSEQVWTR